MFNWYKWASACYVYLFDVAWITVDEAGLESGRRQFRRSEWFTRGWTLQELLAPSNMLFLHNRWRLIGTKADLLDELSACTAIQRLYLEVPLSIKLASVAMRMSWVSKRRTTRPEDMSYCLLGIFNINMPLLYGEREQAFIRLQLEIIKRSDDESIFAWTTDDDLHSGMLAGHPQSFAESGSIISFMQRENTHPYAMTNKGLEIRMATPSHRDGPVELALECRKSEEPSEVVIVSLRKVGRGWVRINSAHLKTTAMWPVFSPDANHVFHGYVLQRGL